MPWVVIVASSSVYPSGSALGGELGGDDAGSAAAVIDHHRLPERLRELLPHCARDDVGGAARREADEDADGFGWVIGGSGSGSTGT